MSNKEDLEARVADLESQVAELIRTVSVLMSAGRRAR